MKPFDLLHDRPSIVRVLWWFGLVTIALIGVWFVLRATTRGAGISPDSTVYISMARGILVPLGYSFALQGGGDFPPLYPTLLAVGGVISGDPATAARCLNALLFGCNIVVVGWILKRILPQSFWAPLFGAVLMVTSVTILTIHAMAWSEPTFLFFGFGGMIALASFIERHQVWPLVLAGVAMALAAMDRYVGISVAFTGISALLLLLPGTLRRKVAAATLFGAIACLPLAAWMTHQPTRRVLTFQLPPREYFQLGYDTFSAWLVPTGSPLLVNGRPVIIIGLAILVALGIRYAWRVRTRQRPPRTVLARIPALFYIVNLFAVSYLQVNFLAKIFLGPSLELHNRALSPVFVAGFIVFISCAVMILASVRILAAWLQIGMALLAVGVMWYSVNSAWRYVERSRTQGLGYNSEAWQDSPTIAQVRALPQNLMIYSNGSDAIYFLTSRPVTRLPNKVDKMNLVGNQAYLAQIRQVGVQLVAGRGVIVYLEGFPDRWYQPNEQDLTAELSLQIVAREADGVIFK